MSTSSLEAERLRFVLDFQRHCDHYLARIADPVGKSVLVLGCGAGTEMLWAMRRGAREVVGIDSTPQNADTLEHAARELSVDVPPFEIHQMQIEQCTELGRRFDLVLSNNVFEHVGDLEGALRAAGDSIEPNVGRIAIFTDPLYYSSAGSHLPVAPWEHLWGDAPAVRDRLLAEGEPQLAEWDLASWMEKAVTLNRMRLTDFLSAIVANDLVILNLRLERDRNLTALPEHLERLRGCAAAADRSVTDLAIEGISVELTRFDASAPSPRPEQLHSVEDRRSKGLLSVVPPGIRARLSAASAAKAQLKATQDRDPE